MPELNKEKKLYDAYWWQLTLIKWDIAVEIHRPLDWVLPGATGQFLHRVWSRELLKNWALHPFGLWSFLGPNNITQKLEDWSLVNSIQVQGLGHERYADSLLLIFPQSFCFHVSLGRLLPWSLSSLKIFLFIFSTMSLYFRLFSQHPYFLVPYKAGFYCIDISCLVAL